MFCGHFCGSGRRYTAKKGAGGFVEGKSIAQRILFIETEIEKLKNTTERLLSPKNNTHTNALKDDSVASAKCADMSSQTTPEDLANEGESTLLKSPSDNFNHDKEQS